MRILYITRLEWVRRQRVCEEAAVTVWKNFHCFFFFFFSAVEEMTKDNDDFKLLKIQVTFSLPILNQFPSKNENNYHVLFWVAFWFLIQTIILKVNIDCDGCRLKVKKLLQKIEGTFLKKRESLLCNVHFFSYCSWIFTLYCLHLLSTLDR